MLRALDKPLLLVDLHANSVVQPGKEYELQEERMVPSAQFKALVYLEESEPMKYAPR